MKNQKIKMLTDTDFETLKYLKDCCYIVNDLTAIYMISKGFAIPVIITK